MISRHTEIPSQASTRTMFLKTSRKPGPRVPPLLARSHEGHSLAHHGASRLDDDKSLPRVETQKTKTNDRLNNLGAQESAPIKRVAQRATGKPALLHNISIDSPTPSSIREGSKRVAEEHSEEVPVPKRVIKFNVKGGNTSVSTPNSQSTSSSQEQATIASIASESGGGAGYESRHVFGELNPQTNSLEYSLNASSTQEISQMPSMITQGGGMRELRDESLLSDSPLKSISSQISPSISLQEVTESVAGESSKSRGPGISKTIPVFPIACRIPHNQVELVGKSTPDSRSRNVGPLQENTEKLHYASVGTQPSIMGLSDAKCQTSSGGCHPPAPKSDDATVAEVLRMAWAMMDQCKALSTLEVATTIARIKAMAHSRLKQHETDDIDWIVIWKLHNHMTLDELVDEVRALSEMP